MSLEAKSQFFGLGFQYYVAARFALTHIVSGTGSKQRLVNYNFARRQAETMPGFRPVWAKGMIWGFAHLRLSFDDAIVTIITTPDDATGDVERAYEYEFDRRTSTANRRPHLSVP